MSTRPDTGDRPPVTLRTIARMAKANEKFACLTAYDYTTAKWLERAGVHALLVGDSAANVVLGRESTVGISMDFLVELTAAVKRGAPNTLLMADMPFMSYQASDEDGVRNAARFLSEASADIVKVEADIRFASVIEKIERAGIPVCAHIGTRPQSAALTAGPKASGRTDIDAQRIVADAIALEQAGACMLLIEAVPPETTERVLEATSVPLIGIGAGTACHGQILVVNDLLGLTDRPPRFADPVETLGARIQAAGETWIDRVSRGEIGGKAYTMQTDGKPMPHTSTAG
ncbi:MAG: 3-methyl-2-oxobutanoate hydroxymethyltransferase [Planctomycetota bacterium]